jgi:hypothetical protein
MTDVVSLAQFKDQLRRIALTTQASPWPPDSSRAYYGLNLRTHR